MNYCLLSEILLIKHHCGTTELDKFVSAAATIRIMSIVQFVLSASEGHLTRLMGNVLLSILYFFLIWPMTRSTCIRTLASCLVFSTSL